MTPLLTRFLLRKSRLCHSVTLFLVKSVVEKLDVFFNRKLARKEVCHPLKA